MAASLQDSSGQVRNSREEVVESIWAAVSKVSGVQADAKVAVTDTDLIPEPGTTLCSDAGNWVVTEYQFQNFYDVVEWYAFTITVRRFRYTMNTNMELCPTLC